jgi:hypothetical protein
VDLAFHCIALAHVDPGSRSRSFVLLGREWYTHPNGQLPAYEWSLGDVNPPVHALAAPRCTRSQATRTTASSSGSSTLPLNFTWWVNRKDSRATTSSRRLPRAR